MTEKKEVCGGRRRGAYINSSVLVFLSELKEKGEGNDPSGALKSAGCPAGVVVGKERGC